MVINAQYLGAIVLLIGAISVSIERKSEKLSLILVCKDFGMFGYA